MLLLVFVWFSLLYFVWFDVVYDLDALLLLVVGLWCCLCCVGCVVVYVWCSPSWLMLDVFVFWICVFCILGLIVAVGLGFALLAGWGFGFCLVVVF